MPPDSQFSPLLQVGKALKSRISSEHLHCCEPPSNIICFCAHFSSPFFAGFEDSYPGGRNFVPRIDGTTLQNPQPRATTQLPDGKAATARDQSGALQYLEVFGDGGRGHFEWCGELRDRCFARGEARKNRASSRVGERSQASAACAK